MNIQSIGQSFFTYPGMSGMQGMQGNFHPPKMDADTIMENEDANSDGALTVDETRLTEEMFADADTDSDGQLSIEELEEMLETMVPPTAVQGMESGGGAPPGMPPGPPDIDAIFEQEDTDGDGMISAEESALSSDMFSNIDADGDGYITAEEIEQSIESNNTQGVQTDEMYANQELNWAQAMAAYQNAMQSFISFGIQEDDFLGTGAYQGIFV